jgi:tetratricopeptide (TPR) repeat protein
MDMIAPQISKGVVLRVLGSWMTSDCRLLLSSTLCCAVLCGCRMTGPRMPVAQDVAECRKLSQRAVGALQRGDPVTAQNLAQRAVGINPQDAQAQHYYSEALWVNGQQQAALSAAEAAWKLNHDDPLYAVRLGERKLELGQTAEAIQYANDGLELCPNCESAWALRARANQVRGDLDAALSDYQRALALSPQNQNLLLEVAELHRRSNRPQRALSLLGTIRELSPPGEESVQVLLLESEAYASLQRHDDLVRVRRQIAQRLPSTETWTALAQAQELVRDQAGMAQSLAKAAEFVGSGAAVASYVKPLEENPKR